MYRKAQLLRRVTGTEPMGMDYSEKYELDVKVGNRIGRRLRALGQSIAKGSGKIRNAVEAFDPNAFDGDGDGLIQDGSPWERPVVLRSQASPSAIQVEQDAVAAATPTPSDVRDYSRSTRTSTPTPSDATPQRDVLDLYTDVDINEIDVIPTPPQIIAAGATGVSATLRDRATELRNKDHRLPGSTADMTPEELAELAVPDTMEGVIEHASTQTVGHPSQYASQADYEKALETQRAHARSMYTALLNQHDKARSLYDAKYGTGSYEEHAHRNKALFRENMVKLLGDHVVLSSLVGTPVIDTQLSGTVTTLPGLEDLSQQTFLDEIIANPNTPPWKRQIYKVIRDRIPRQQLMYLQAVDNDFEPQLPQSIVLSPPLNPLHAFAAYLLSDRSAAAHALPTNGGDGAVVLIRMDKPELLLKPTRSWNTQGMTGEELLGMVWEDYFAWSANRKIVTDAGVTREAQAGSLLTPEQLKARIALAAQAPSIHHAAQILFPGQSETTLAMFDPATGRRKLDVRLDARVHTESMGLIKRDPIPQGMPVVTHDKDTIQKLRAVLERALRENPMMLEAWQKYGVPAYTVLHPLFTAEAHRLPDDAYITAAEVRDRTPAGRRKLLSRLRRLGNRKFYVAEGSRMTATEDQQGRQTNSFFSRLLRGKQGSYDLLAADGEIGKASRSIDQGGDIPNLFGSYASEGLGAFTTKGSGIISIAPETIDISLMTPIGVSEDIIDTQNLNSVTQIGPAATPLHEWVHFYHEHLQMEGIRILTARAAEKEAEFIAAGDKPGDARTKAREWLDKTLWEHGFHISSDPEFTYAQAKTDGRVVSWAKFWHDTRKKLLGDDLYDARDPNDPRSAVPQQRPVIDFDKYEEYGYASRKEMEDAFLLGMFRLYKDGFQQGGLLADLSERGLERNPLASRDDLRQRRSLAAQKAPTSTEGYVRTAYGQLKWQERIPEAVLGVFMRIFRDKPFMVNDAMLDIITTIFMRRDKDGPLTEKHGILGIRRRRKKRDGTYDTDFAPDLVPATSTERAIMPDERRGPDGHRAGLRSAGRVSAVDSRSMRFDPDERSRLRSGASNIGIDTDERLYAFDAPVTVSDFRARSRVLSVGDHRFYDTGIPYAQSAAMRRRTTLGYIAGRAFVNRNKPHDGDMVRAISATQFGMFVDDVPTYDTTSETDRAMLRGLVSGRVRDLPASSRARVETALKNATHIHSAVQGTQPNKHELYRVVRVDPRSLVEGLVVGERIPLPITAFTRARPRVDAGDAVIRIQRGAKAIDVDNDQYLTQGVFEVVAIDMVDGQVTATIKHVETYDPRHDAMRPVDRFSDKPGAMRKFGSPRPRYTREEQQRMEVDLARRTDTAAVNERMYGLRSTGASGVGADIDDELDIIAENTAQRSESARQLVAKTLGRIRATLNRSVSKRLDKAREGIAKKYGGARPWVDDARTIQRFAAYDPKRRLEVLQNIFGRVDGVLRTGPLGAPEVRWVDRIQGETSQKLEVIGGFHGYKSELSLDQLDALLERGEMPIYYEGMGRRIRGRGEFRPGRKWVAATVDVTLDNEEREVLQSIRDMLAVGERAYLMDKGGQSISTGSTELIVRPRKTDEWEGSIFTFRGTNTGPGDEDSPAFKYYGKVLYDDPSMKPPSGDAGTFTRLVYVSNGELVVRHENMYMTGIPDRGAATILNQHAFQWWKQNPGTRVTLSAAMDGPIVWPRHGFHPKDSGTRRLDFDEQGVDFAKLIRAAEFIVGALSNDRATRKRAHESMGDLDEALIQARLDKNGGRRRKFSSSSLRDNVLGMTGFGDKTDADISESDMRMRERIGLWLALAIQDRNREPGVERKASLTLLANLLDVESMEPSQKNAWKELFRNIYSGEFSMELDSVDNDPDYLPSFVISDDDPTASIIARRAAIAEERRRGAALDLMLPKRETERETLRALAQQEGDVVQRDIVDPEVVTEEELSRRALQTIGERVGRLNGIFNSSRNSITGDTDPTQELLHTRETTGGDELPLLIQPYDADARLKRAANYGQNTPNPWINQSEDTDGIILVGITQDSRMRNRFARLTVRNFLTGNRSTEWDEEEDSFLLDPIFTTTPDMYTDRFADPDDPTVDPARNKVALLGVTDKNARWVTRAGLGLLARDLDDVMKGLLPDRDDLDSPWSAISALKNVRVRGEYLLIRGHGDVYTVNSAALMNYLDEFGLSNQKKDDMYSIFGMFADHLTYSERGSDSDRQSVKEQASWLFGLFSSLTDPTADSRKRQTAAILLGYDFLSESQSALARSRIHVLNRGSLTMVDEAVSLSDIRRFSGMSVTPRNPRSLRSSGIATTMLLDDDGAPTLLRMTDPLGVTATQMSTYAYSRVIRQEYGIEPPRALRLGGNTAFETAKKQERAWFAGRNNRRKAGRSLPGVTPEMYAADIQTRIDRHTKLTERIEALDEKLSELDNRYLDLDNAGELTPEIDNEIDKEFDAVMAEKILLEMEQKDISDTIASDINTLNEMLDAHQDRAGLAYAIRKFLGEQVGLDVPEDYRQRLQDVLAALDAQASAAPSADDLQARHKILQDLLDDDDHFDIRWQIQRDATDEDELVDGVDLEDHELDDEDIGSYEANHWLEWIYRGFFDQRFDAWKRSRPARWFDVMPGADFREKSTRRRLEDMLDPVFEGITAGERSRWSRDHDQLLREEYNADYEEALIDATPSDSSSVPRGVPERIWKKIIASARLARRTPYEGEREAAINSAKRLLTPHRPDLADDEYIMSLRSMGARGAPYPMINGVNLRSSGSPTRGAAPSVIGTPKPDRFRNRLIERLGAYGVKEEDMRPDGKYGKVLLELFNRQTAQPLEMLMRRIDNETETIETDYGTYQPISDTPFTDEDKTVLKAIVTEAAKLASQSGWGVIAIEGHRVKKVNGPIHSELADVLGDEADIALIRTMGSPTYDRLMAINAVWARELNRLNKMFGSYEHRREDGTFTRVGAGFIGGTSAYKMFLDAGLGQYVGDSWTYTDARRNVIMTVKKSVSVYDGSPLSPRQIIEGLGRENPHYNDLLFGNTNDAIMGAMLEAVGVLDHDIVGTRDNLQAEFRGDSRKGSLAALRQRLAKAREQAQQMEFAPTPAGRHMESLVRREIERLEGHIDLFERLGQRFVQMLKESEGLNSEQLRARVRQMADMFSHSKGEFSNMAATDVSGEANMFESALDAFLSMQLGSPNMPRITDDSTLESGTHEIGHFILGQGFTRHGEYMSNFWPYALMGPAWWRNFADIQKLQAEGFDRMTLTEGLGANWTREQRELYDSLSQDVKSVLKNTELVSGFAQRLVPAMRRSTLTRMLEDTIQKVNDDPTIDDIVKAEIVASLRGDWDGVANMRNIRPDEYTSLERLRESGELSDDVMKALGIYFDPETYYEDPYIRPYWNSTLPWDPFVTIDLEDLGWQRTPSSQTSLRSSGARRPRGRPRNLEREQAVIRLVEAGYASGEIARELGIGAPEASKLLRRLKNEGKITKVSRTGKRFVGADPQGARSEMDYSRKITRQQRQDAYFNYKNNRANGMSVADAARKFIDEIGIGDQDARVDQETTTKSTQDFDNLVSLLDLVYKGIPADEKSSKGPQLDEDVYMIVNEMKLLGFSGQETAEILGVSRLTAHNYRMMHYRAYIASQKPKTLRSGGASPNARARVRDLVKANDAVGGPSYDPLYALMSNQPDANFSNSTRERIFRKLVDEIEEVLRLHGWAFASTPLHPNGQPELAIPEDDEGLEKLAEKLFKRAVGKRDKSTRLPDVLRQGLAEFIRLRKEDYDDRSSRREQTSNFLSTAAQQGMVGDRNLGQLRSSSNNVPGPVGPPPSRGETPITPDKRWELVSIGRRAQMTQDRLDSLNITEKSEKDFTVQEYEKITRLLDDSDRKLDRASQMLEDKKMRLQDEQLNLESRADAGELTEKGYFRLTEVEELLYELEQQEEVLNRAYEANRLARLMIRALRANSNNPRRDQYDNKYVVITNPDGTLAGMAMWGFLGVDVTFNTPNVPYSDDPESLPPDNRITGRMMFVDYLVSFQNTPGMGSYLFKRVLEDGRGRNVRKVFLETTDSSNPFWSRIGFRERRIAGSTSQFHEYVARVDEMLEAIDAGAAGADPADVTTTLRSSGSAITPQRRHIPPYKDIERIDPTGENLDLLPTYPDPLAAEIAEDLQPDPTIFSEIGWRIDTGQYPPRRFPRYVARFKKLLEHYTAYMQGGVGIKLVAGKHEINDDKETYKKFNSLIGFGGYGRGGYFDINRLLRLGPEKYADDRLQEIIKENERIMSRYQGSLTNFALKYPDQYGIVQSPEKLIEKEVTDARKKIANIDSIIKDSPPLEESITVFRGITNWKVMQMIDEAGVGGIVSEKGYMSTSLSPAAITMQYRDYGDDQPPQNSRWAKWDMFSASYRGKDRSRLRAMPILKILVPAGARGTITTALTPREEGGNYDWEGNAQVIEEAEFLLPRGTKLKIVSIDDGYVTVEVVLD